jgi:hypothetical protein
MARTPTNAKCCAVDHMSRKTVKSCKNYHPRLRNQRFATRLLDNLGWHFKGDIKQFDKFLTIFGNKLKSSKFPTRPDDNLEDSWELASRAEDGLGIGCSCSNETSWVEDLDKKGRHQGWEKVVHFWDYEDKKWYKAAPGGRCKNPACYSVSSKDTKGLLTIIGEITSRYKLRSHK